MATPARVIGRVRRPNGLLVSTDFGDRTLTGRCRLDGGSAGNVCFRPSAALRRSDDVDVTNWRRHNGAASVEAPTSAERAAPTTTIDRDLTICRPLSA